MLYEVITDLPERRRQPVRRLVEDRRPRLAPQLPQNLATRFAAGREKTLEGEALGRQAGDA